MSKYYSIEMNIQYINEGILRQIGGWEANGGRRDCWKEVNTVSEYSIKRVFWKELYLILYKSKHTF